MLTNWQLHAQVQVKWCLLETAHNWFQLLEDGNEIGAVFFDFRKAFDSVPHRALLSKLESLNLNSMLLRWVQSHLAGRTQQVVLNGTTSDPLPVLLGVPQGCHWSSTISYIYQWYQITASLSQQSPNTLLMICYCIGQSCVKVISPYSKKISIESRIGSTAIICNLMYRNVY